MLKCHSTAYSFTEKIQTTKIKPEEGVTCESCHGPGKNYKSKTVMKNHEASIAKGMVFPATKRCVRCHNDAAPSWKTDRYKLKDGKTVGFDVKQAYEKIKHPNPAAKNSRLKAGFYVHVLMPGSSRAFGFLYAGVGLR